MEKVGSWEKEKNFSKTYIKIEVLVVWKSSEKDKDQFPLFEMFCTKSSSVAK